MEGFRFEKKTKAFEVSYTPKRSPANLLLEALLLWKRRVVDPFEGY
jgi:hypothetical protein